MQIDPEDFRKHYASLSDQALLELHRNELVEVARDCYDAELARRRTIQRQSLPFDPSPGGPPKLPWNDDDKSGPLISVQESDDDSVTGRSFHIESGKEPAWLKGAATACIFNAHPGNHSAPEIDLARDVLENAGIPCQAVLRKQDPAEVTRQPRYYYELMVPGALSLHAVSVLDQQIYNAEFAAAWKTHFETLSDDDFRALRLDDLTAGWWDRVERLTQAYQDERERRRRAKESPEKRRMLG